VALPNVHTVLLQQHQWFRKSTPIAGVDWMMRLLFKALHSVYIPTVYRIRVTVWPPRINDDETFVRIFRSGKNKIFHRKTIFSFLLSHICWTSNLPSQDHTYLMSWLNLQVFYLWRHYLLTAPPFILWWSNLEILFAPLHRSPPFIGGLRCQAIQKEHGPYIAERTQKAVYIVRCLCSGFGLLI
jgi:hypothetical protein